MPLVEAMTTQRAVRRVLPDAVDDAIVLRCIELALKAPTGSNGQNWEFVVVKDQVVKEQLAARYRQSWRLYGGMGKKAAGGDEPMQKILRAVTWQVEHFVEIPVLVVACLRGSGTPKVPKLPNQVLPQIAVSSFYGSIYPSVQNLLLAARSMGLGASLITLPLWSTASARRILGLPHNVTPCCIVPLGWPRGRYGPTTPPPCRGGGPPGPVWKAALALTTSVTTCGRGGHRLRRALSARVRWGWGPKSISVSMTGKPILASSLAHRPSHSALWRSQASVTGEHPPDAGPDLRLASTMRAGFPAKRPPLSNRLPPAGSAT